MDLATSLPPNVVALLAPIADAITQDARDLATAQLRQKAKDGWDFGGYVGGSGSYARGAARALNAVGLTLAEITGLGWAGDYDADVQSSEYVEDDDEDDAPDDHEEGGAHYDEIRSCCGYCQECGEHVNDWDCTDVTTIYCPRGPDHEHCNECEHTCD